MHDNLPPTNELGGSPLHDETVAMLEQQADRAREGFVRSLDQIRQDVQATIDPARSAQKHPWTSVGAAALAGFVAAAALRNRGGKKASAERPAPASPQPAAASLGGTAPASTPTAVELMFDLGKVLVTTQLLPMFQAWQQAKAAKAAAEAAAAHAGAADGTHANHNGHGPDADAPH